MQGQFALHWYNKYCGHWIRLRLWQRRVSSHNEARPVGSVRGFKPGEPRIFSGRQTGTSYAEKKFREVFASLAACGELAATMAQALQHNSRSMSKACLNICRAHVSLEGRCCRGRVEIKQLSRLMRDHRDDFGQATNTAFALDQCGAAGKHLVISACGPQFELL